MKIALLGTRGIPASYGGFETFAEELSRRLVQRGHQVTVYCRERQSFSTYLGVQLRYLPTIRHKYLDTVAHTAVSTIDLLVHAHDVALYCNGANAIYTGLPRLRGIPVVLNVDGLERKRKKWNRLGKAWYLVSEWLSTVLPTVVVSDAEAVAAYFRTAYRKETVFIPYGADVGPVLSADVLPRLNLQAGEYFLYVSRFEPENNALLVREAFERTATRMKLALVGDAPYAHEYIQRVRDTSDPRVVIPGAIYGQGYRELQSHSFAYIHATEVGGTHPALIEAMGRGALVLFLATPENAEVAGGVGIPFRHDTLTEALAHSLSLPAGERRRLQEAAMARVRERYSWDAVTAQYERLFQSVVSRSAT
jgi:glycosyltransferase involved in cell wall biosynthesis